MFDRSFIRVVKIDLTNGISQIIDRPDLVSYLGGLGLATKLLDEEIHYDLEALDPQQPIIFAIGPLSTIFPVVTKTCCMFKSPLTGELGESYAGGRLAMAMLYAGYDAVVITGRAERPVYISITSREVKIKRADPLWGTNTEEAGRYLRENESGRGFRSILRIGQAGERLVRFANLNVDTYRHFGRLGPGAVFGSKHLKGMVIAGDNQYPIPSDRQKEYRRVYADIYKRVTETEVMEKYHDLGTPVNVLKLNAMNSLPTRNLQSGNFEKADDFSGEAFAQERLVRKVACIGCPIGCIHIGQYRRLFGEKSHEYETNSLAYDHELIFALGTFLGTDNKDDFFTLLDKVESYGMDVMTTGVLLGWMTEAFQKGLISQEELGTKLEFGYCEGYLQAIDQMVRGGNDVYRTVILGVEAAAARYGGLEYAMALGRTEMTGYHTGYGAALGQAVGARHSHLDNGGYSFDQSRDPKDIEQFVKAIYDEEVSRCAVNSLVICLFARNVYDLGTVAAALNSIGLKWTEAQLQKLAEDTLRLKLQIKKKLGFDFRDLRFPGRLFETEALHGRMDESTMQKMLDLYLNHIEQLIG